MERLFNSVYLTIILGNCFHQEEITSDEQFDLEVGEEVDKILHQKHRSLFILLMKRSTFISRETWILREIEEL